MKGEIVMAAVRREELLKIAKPILFNTEMVRAILNNLKGATRRNIKGFIPEDAIWGYTAFTPKGYISCRGTFADKYGEKFFKLPCQPGGYLYVRETWSWYPCYDCGMDTEEGCCNKTSLRFYHPEKHEYGCYVYRASFEDNEMPFDRWYPSIHMSKEAARIFLKVTDIRVERLQDIKPEDAVKEGTRESSLLLALDEFIGIWNSTVKKEELEQYGWEANPWVWVIQFERLECN